MSKFDPSNWFHELKWNGGNLLLWGSVGFGLTVGALAICYWKLRPAKRVPAVIFDFDQCLMKIHMWATFRNTSLKQIQFPEEYFGDPEFLRWLIPALHDKGVKVAVATFGRQEVVLEAMRTLFGQDQTFFGTHNVSTPKDFGVPEGSSMGSKNNQLQALSKKFSIPLKDILFFDDDSHNIEEAKKIGVQAQEAMPLTRTIWEDVGEPWTRKMLRQPLRFPE
eukprot:CAMPEP_0174328724 /NCGR_PEP_ID=MMETSP0810-20121108/15321_1 /TAXON_ID=73025 ORGANISM="Eutreptiella gymnastica-like, Strain CCMP1594" /NCGR_SAMPLE_ID=MMETSP0810 /ASSEMBLY_ACC=CAM_ASM_000659 /LENGTH=220 /DNA_ID=CAMNT_0015442893 /DNA_START=10 /DNA_END=672 /DNA_ORIENTATION=+